MTHTFQNGVLTLIPLLSNYMATFVLSKIMASYFMLMRTTDREMFVLTRQSGGFETLPVDELGSLSYRHAEFVTQI